MGASFSEEKVNYEKTKETKFGGYKNLDKPRPGYYITPSTIYYRGKEMTDVQPSSFQKLGNGWARDKNSIFFQGKVVPEAHNSTFRLENKFGRDKNNLYYRGKIVK